MVTLGTAISWSLTASVNFSVKSLYAMLTEGSVLDIAGGTVEGKDPA